MKRILAGSLFFFVCCFGVSYANEIHLKNGRVIEVDSCWEENNQVKYEKYGAIVGIGKEIVERIEHKTREETTFYATAVILLKNGKVIEATEVQDEGHTVQFQSDGGSQMLNKTEVHRIAQGSFKAKEVVAAYTDIAKIEPHTPEWNDHRKKLKSTKPKKIIGAYTNIAEIAPYTPQWKELRIKLKSAIDPQGDLHRAWKLLQSGKVKDEKALVSLRDYINRQSNLLTGFATGDIKYRDVHKEFEKLAAVGKYYSSVQRIAFYKDLERKHGKDWYRKLNDGTQMLNKTEVHRIAQGSFKAKGRLKAAPKPRIVSSTPSSSGVQIKFNRALPSDIPYIYDEKDGKWHSLPGRNVKVNGSTYTYKEYEGDWNRGRLYKNGVLIRIYTNGVDQGIEAVRKEMKETAKEKATCAATTKAMETTLSEVEFFINTGKVWYEKREFNRAIAAFTDTLKLLDPPHDTKTYITAIKEGNKWKKMGWHKKAKVFYTNAIEIYPGYEACQKRGGDWASIGKKLKSYISEAYFYRGLSWLGKGDTERAKADYNALANRKGCSSDFQDVLSRLEQQITYKTPISNEEALEFMEKIAWHIKKGLSEEQNHAFMWNMNTIVKRLKNSNHRNQCFLEAVVGFYNSLRSSELAFLSYRATRDYPRTNEALTYLDSARECLR